MSVITRFEDIKAWQIARKLSYEIYDATNDGRFSNDYQLMNQTRRAVNSIMLNIAEGYGRQSNKEFRQFLYVAHGSAAEVQSALYIAKDQRYITSKKFDVLYSQTEELSKAIAGFIKYLGGKK